MESSPFWNPESTVLESGIQYPESGIHSVESRIQECSGFPYMGRKTEPLLTLEPGLYPHTVSCDGTERDSPRTNFPRLRADNGSKEDVYCGQQLSRQNQKPHGKNKIPHDKTKNLMAKPKTSRQNQSYFTFAVKYLVFP